MRPEESNMTDKKARDAEVAQARRYMAMPLTKKAMDRARGHWVPWLIEALDEAEAERDRMRDEAAGYQKLAKESQESQDKSSLLVIGPAGEELRVYGPTPNSEERFAKTFADYWKLINEVARAINADEEVKQVEAERDALKAKLAALVEAADRASLWYSSGRGKIVPSMELLGRAVDAAKVQP